jgi:hypothetical protein
MADRFWRGVNNDFTSTANWSATRTGATGVAAPSASDDVYIYDGTGDITGNVTGVTALSMTIGGLFQGHITGMTIATTTCVVTIEGVAFGKTVSIGAAAGVTLGLIHVKSTKTGAVSIIAGAAGVLTSLRAGKVGNLNIDGSGVVTNFYCAGMPTTCMYSATAFTLAEFRTGSHMLQRSATTLTMDTGAQVMSEFSGVDNAFTTVNVGSSATLRQNTAGTIGTLNAFPGGTLTPGVTKFTVTNSNYWEGANINRNSDKITFTNPPAPFGDVA